MCREKKGSRQDKSEIWLFGGNYTLTTSYSKSEQLHKWSDLWQNGLQVIFADEQQMNNILVFLSLHL